MLATELEALLRAGTPLGSGLRTASARWSGRLRSSADALSRRLDAGVSVDEALRTSPELPPFFRSLAAAGLTTGRAADVLAAYSSSTRHLLWLREQLLRGLMYPAIVVVLGYVLFVILVRTLLPQIAEMVTDFAQAPPRWVGLVERLEATLAIWSWGVPLGVVVLWMLLRLILVGPGSPVGLWGVLPVIRKTLSDIHTASASQLLAALLESEVPLPLALSLAGESLATDRSRRAVEQVADRVRQGVPASQSFREGDGAPPLWRELFARESNPRAIEAGLLQVKDVLSDRARFRAEIVGRVVPVALILVLGTSVVVGYAVVVFGPLVSLWERLGESA